MKSKITGGQTEVVFNTKVLNKYDVKYYRCLETGFIQTEDPFWLEEAYSTAITKLDIGLVSRNELLRNKTVKLLSDCFDGSKRFLDYAGGYGMFTRMMRDMGYDFYHHDIYCQNLFSEFFDLANCKQQSDFEVVTAFEVFEHLANPLEEIGAILQFGNNILFTTELQPIGLENISDWWYVVPETGQHIALYTKKALEYIAKQLGLHLLSDGISMHLFTKEKLPFNPFVEKEREKEPFLIRMMRRKLNRFDLKHSAQTRKSLLQDDFEYIKAKLH
ncbi:class I SAM-dependent methyltransferase [Pedobacter nyackensis]|uniref:Methyltransferase domain-containing protein n=1 Tax=Pedobacter nyackensis TaxID=475255 RepID=A0A1W2BIQ1_9SPHI|nr:class I SAM-dependent methyltransferase [Pedobacter nyackensis]SMC72825.1 Methyltransferase domain-containing protein [Pedobacter nyackensis]